MTTEPTTDSLRTGSTVGPWLLLGYAGHGSYGVVYKVRLLSEPHSMPRALKLALAPNDQRLVREGELLSRLHHPSLPEWVDQGVWHSLEGHAHPFLVMQWIDGLPLYRWARVHSASSRQVLRVLEQVAGALEAVHASGALHRDVKGDNILVEPSGKAFLTDFGSATWAGASPLTESLLPPSTRGYRGPEALRFQRTHAQEPHAHYHARTFDDLYALGVSAYRVVTGEHPPPGTQPEPHHNPYRAPLGARKPPRALNPRVHPALETLIERLLASEAEARGSASALRLAAKAAADQAGSEADGALTSPAPVAVAAVAAPAPVSAVAPGGIRLRWRLALMALSPLMVLGSAWWSSTCSREPPLRFVREEDPAEEAERLREISVGDASVPASVEMEPLNSAPYSVATEIPAEPLPGQRRHPCLFRDVEIRGGCWSRWGDFTPPCGDEGYEWNGLCYVPRYEKQHTPTSDKKRQAH